MVIIKRKLVINSEFFFVKFSTISKNFLFLFFTFFYLNVYKIFEYLIKFQFDGYQLKKNWQRILENKLKIKNNIKIGYGVYKARYNLPVFHVAKRKITKITVIRSPFVNKKSKEQFELKKYFFSVKFPLIQFFFFLVLINSCSRFIKEQFTFFILYKETGIIYFI